MSTIRVGNIGPLTGNTSVIADPGGTGGMSLVSMNPVSASGTAIDFTGIPSWVRRITVLINGASDNSGSSSSINLQLGTSGGFITSGYSGGTTYITSGAGSTTISAGFTTYFNDASGLRYGTYNLYLFNPSNHTWLCTFLIGTTYSGSMHGGGAVTLSSPITQLRLNWYSSGASFDAGSFNCMYE